MAEGELMRYIVFGFILWSALLGLFVSYTPLAFGQQTTMKCLEGTIGFYQQTSQTIFVDKMLKLSSSTWQYPLILSSFTTVAVGTTSAIYDVNFQNLRLKISDTRFASLLSFATNYLVVNNSQIPYYNIKLHDCRLDSDGNCTWSGLWTK